jgi:hypothetical protein
LCGGSRSNNIYTFFFYETTKFSARRKKEKKKERSCLDLLIIFTKPLVLNITGNIITMGMKSYICGLYCFDEVTLLERDEDLRNASAGNVTPTAQILYPDTSISALFDKLVNKTFVGVQPAESEQ